MVHRPFSRDWSIQVPLDSSIKFKDELEIFKKEKPFCNVGAVSINGCECNIHISLKVTVSKEKLEESLLK